MLAVHGAQQATFNLAGRQHEHVHTVSGTAQWAFSCQIQNASQLAARISNRNCGAGEVSQAIQKMLSAVDPDGALVDQGGT